MALATQTPAAERTIASQREPIVIIAGPPDQLRTASIRHRAWASITPTRSGPPSSAIVVVHSPVVHQKTGRL